MKFETGCYVLRFEPGRGFALPDGDACCLGTLRVAKAASSKQLQASGDLYGLASEAEAKSCGIELKEGKLALNRRATIPVFPLEAYRFYLEVKSVTVASSPDATVRLDLQVHRFDASTRQMAIGGCLRVDLSRDAKDRGLYRGVMLAGAAVRGELEMRHVSKFLRRAALRIIPIQNGTGPAIVPPGRSLPKKVPGWKQVFASVGWNLQVLDREHEEMELEALARPWTSFDLGAAWDTLARKIKEEPSVRHDWIYNLLCVSRFERAQFLGTMFDSEAADFNERPRESAAVAALQKLENGQLAQKAFGGSLYYRTALHEVGHAMGLTHTHVGQGLMNTTERLLTRNKAARLQFEPSWHFAPEDAEWLKHGPDIAVRPGGIPRRRVLWQCASLQDVDVITMENEPDMALAVTPVHAKVPFGAPVRLDYVLTNHGAPACLPEDLSLASGFVSGRVKGPDRKTRYFRSAFRSCDPHAPDVRLKAAKEVQKSEGSMTLLRGIDGPLFPEPGAYTVELDVRWDDGGDTHRVLGETAVTIGEYPADRQERLLAEGLLHEPAMMRALVQGDAAGNSRKLLSAAMESEILAPHYMSIAVKCYVMTNLDGSKRGAKKRARAGLHGSASKQAFKFTLYTTKAEQDYLTRLPNWSLAKLAKWLQARVQSPSASIQKTSLKPVP
jgi:hypothetical protein